MGVDYDKLDILEYLYYVEEYDEWENRVHCVDQRDWDRREYWLNWYKEHAIEVWERLTKIERPGQYKLGKNQNVAVNGRTYYIASNECAKDVPWNELIQKGAREICKERKCNSCR